MQVKAVLFDMFDTLMIIEKDHAFYSPAVKSMHSYLVQNGVEVSFAVFRDAYIRARDALYEEADANMEEPHFNLRVGNALSALGYKAQAEDSHLVQGASDAFCHEFMNYVRIDEGAAEALIKLHGRYRLGIVSNFAITECVTRILDRHGLTSLFDIIVVSAAVNRRKPHPEIFRHALRKLKLKASEVAFVGDTVDADIKGAREAGMKTVYIERRPQKDLENSPPDETIKSLSELPAAIEKLEA
jgi:HAD superfamily hydrolase (TIGR01662 family)